MANSKGTENSHWYKNLVSTLSVLKPPELALPSSHEQPIPTGTENFTICSNTKTKARTATQEEINKTGCHVAFKRREREEESEQ